MKQEIISLKKLTDDTFLSRFLILASAVTGYISISAFSSLIGIPIGIKSSAIGLKI